MDKRDEYLIDELKPFWIDTEDDGGAYQMRYEDIKNLIDETIKETTVQIIDICNGCYNQCTSKCDTLKDLRKKMSE